MDTAALVSIAQQPVAIIVVLVFYKIVALVVGLSFAYLGYRLLVAGILSPGGDFDARWQDIRVVLKRASPGTFFALFGVMIVCVALFTGLGAEMTNHEEQDAILQRRAAIENILSQVVDDDGALIKSKLELLMNLASGTEGIDNYILNARSPGDLRSRLGDIPGPILEDMASVRLAQ